MFVDKSEYCINHDTQTAYPQIAALCGCVSITVPETEKGRENYRNHTENIFDTGYGEAFGFDEKEIEYSKNTAHKALEKYQNNNKDGLVQVQKFVSECENYFS